MATKITVSNHGDSLQGSPEKRLDVAPDGTLWAAIVTQGSPGALKFFRSSNGGSTWAYASGSDLLLAQSNAVPSFFIDADGYAHVSWLTWGNDPQLIIYARGTPTGGGGWSWQQITVSPALGPPGRRHRRHRVPQRHRLGRMGLLEHHRRIGRPHVAHQHRSVRVSLGRRHGVRAAVGHRRLPAGLPGVRAHRRRPHARLGPLDPLHHVPAGPRPGRSGSTARSTPAAPGPGKRR